MAALEPPVAGSDALYRVLRSGKNVYSGIGGWYVDPASPEWAEIDGACKEGRVSVAAGGNIPGLVTDALPMFTSGYCGRVERIWCKEADHVARYPSAHELQAHVGFGLPVDEPNPAEEMINGLYEWAFRQSAHQVAAAMGVRLDSFRLVSKELAPPTRTSSSTTGCSSRPVRARGRGGPSAGLSATCPGIRLYASSLPRMALGPIGVGTTLIPSLRSRSTVSRRYGRR
jgi:4-hydroxy-tetrahydrodipicolinate reductase